MTPVMCRTKHQPPTSYGDCLRACVATVVDMDGDNVPHFADNGATGDEALDRARDWLVPRGLTVACFAFPGAIALPDLLEYMETMNPTVTWLLFGSTALGPGKGAGGDHVNVCQGGKVVHDPAWIPTSIKSPTSDGIWQVWVVSRV